MSKPKDSMILSPYDNNHGNDKNTNTWMENKERDEEAVV